jgi:uncharacterized protein YeaO (DUF488 family)
MDIEVRRAYEEGAAGTGLRFLVDRLWPRGIKKAELHLDGWLKDVAPSDELRRWFGHDPRRWSEFSRRYGEELDEHPEAWTPLRDAAEHARVILLYGARDEQHNNAIALRQYLERKLRRRSSRRGASSRGSRDEGPQTRAPRVIAAIARCPRPRAHKEQSPPACPRRDRPSPR